MLRQMTVCMGIKLLHLKTNLIYLWLCWGSVAAWAFLQLWQAGAALQVQRAGSSACAQGLGCRLQQLEHMGSAVAAPRLQNMAQQLQRTGFVARRHVGSSWIRDRKPLSPALVGIFFNTEPPGKPGHEIQKEPVDNVTCRFSKH